MNSKIFIFFIFFNLLLTFCFSQDTLRIQIPDNNSEIENESKKDINTSTFWEVISFKKDSFKVEKVCFDGELKRIINEPDFYKRINDSLILINNQEINYHMQSDTDYLINIATESYISIGNARSLIPLIKNGTHKIYNSANDLILEEEYNNNKINNLVIIKKMMNDSIYRFVDEEPIFPEKYGSLEKYISENMNTTSWTQESTIQGTIIINVVINNEGFVHNAKILKGIDPTYDREVLKVVSKLPQFMPAKLKGKEVSSYLTIPVKIVLE